MSSFIRGLSDIARHYLREITKRIMFTLQLIFSPDFLRFGCESEAIS